MSKFEADPATYYTIHPAVDKDLLLISQSGTHPEPPVVATEGPIFPKTMWHLVREKPGSNVYTVTWANDTNYKFLVKNNVLYISTLDATKFDIVRGEDKDTWLIQVLNKDEVCKFEKAIEPIPTAPQDGTKNELWVIKNAPFPPSA